MLHSALINVMVKAARHAGRSLKRDLGEIEHLQVSLKGPANFVTKADKRAEEMLYEDLAKARPGYGFIGEEGGTREGADKSHTWIVDPLDGTTNFLHGIPQFAISIGLQREGTIIAGVIYNPANEELYIAERGKGAFLNDQRLRVAGRRKLNECVIACGLPHIGRGDHNLSRKEMTEIQNKVAGLRRFGAASLDMAFVASGRLDGYWERNLSPWDMAAGQIIVREAGGTVSGTAELAQEKPTISMPALEPDDAIEEEYVTHYAELGQTVENTAAHTFGSFTAPILYSRFVLLNPPDARIRVGEQSGSLQPLVGENNGMVIRIWERNNIAQTITEPFLPAINLLPTVTVAAAEKTRDRLRDELIEATRIGLRADEAAAELHLAQNAVSPNPGEAEQARRLYRFVTSKLDSTGPDWAGSSAEETLANGQGSRTMALLALARSTGLRAGLLLARKVDQSCGKERDLSCYSEPLVRFWLLNGESVDVDAESDDLPFGAIPPFLDSRDALFVPLFVDEEKKPEIVTLATRQANEKSLAEGDLSFHQGDLVADIQVQLGSMRAQEVRSMLRNAAERERQAFFEQLAMRIFPGAIAVTGSALYENDPEHPLKLSLHCVAPQFISQQNGTVEIDQLAPALGLLLELVGLLFQGQTLGPVEALRVSGLVGHLHQVTLRVERPRVVEALEDASVAGILTADRRAAVGARVEQRADLAVGAAHEDDRPAADVAPDEVAGVWNLGLVANVQPAAVEDPLPLELVDRLRRHRRAVHAEQSALPIVGDQRVELIRLHVAPPRFWWQLPHLRRRAPPQGCSGAASARTSARPRRRESWTSARRRARNP
jgi:myo-inositol-1(or 4)-monophosphatase